MGYRNQIRSRAAEAGNRVSISIGGVGLQGTPVEPFGRWRRRSRRSGPTICKAAADGPLAVTVEVGAISRPTISIASAAPPTAPNFISAPSTRMQKGETVRLAADPDRVLVYPGAAS